MAKILSFDTSNYTTSACVFDTCDGVIWENRIMLEVKDGSLGLRQNDAVFLHTKNLNSLFDDIPKFDYDYICASKCPSERENSYMPCFLVGVSFATSISNLLGKPLYLCSHQKNHICAAAYSANKTDLLNRKFIAYHISGGTTDVCLCTPSSDGVFIVEKIGGTADISCGQFIDRAGGMLGLKFPCGKSIESIADTLLSGKIKIKNNSGFYNFSGFQNKVQKMKEEGIPDKIIATFILDVVYTFVIDSIQYFRKIHGNLPILMSGGVMSNKIISSSVCRQFNDAYFSLPYYSLDHSLGTAFLCAYERGLLND